MGELRETAAPRLKVGDSIPTFAREVTVEKMVDFERVVWERGQNSHNDPAAAQRDGLKRTVASGQNQMAFLHELLERGFGDGWVYGGSISVRYVRPVCAGDRITPHAQVGAITREDGRDVVALAVWCENQDGHKTAVGTARASAPSVNRSWILQMKGQSTT